MTYQVMNYFLRIIIIVSEIQEFIKEQTRRLIYYIISHVISQLLLLIVIVNGRNCDNL